MTNKFTASMQITTTLKPLHIMSIAVYKLNLQIKADSSRYILHNIIDKINLNKLLIKN